MVTCQPLLVCDIELEAGEEVTSVSLGDSSRWLVSPALSGDRDTLTPDVLHDLRISGNALLLTHWRRPAQSDPGVRAGLPGPTAGNVPGASVGEQFGSTASEFIRRGMSRAPTLDIRPGFAFNVMVTHDIVFPGRYDERRQP